MFDNKIDFERGLHPVQLKSFLQEDGALHPLLSVLQDKDFQIEFRKDYFNIYYMGGSILRVEGQKMKFAFDIKYCNNKPETRYKHQIQSILKGQLLHEATTHLKDYFAYEMRTWFAVNPKKEREYQQRLCVANRVDESALYIVDIEYAITDYGRADILAVQFNPTNNRYQIYIIEYKNGHKAISSGIAFDDNGAPVPSSSKFSAGLYKHYMDATRLVNEKREPLEKTIRNSMLTRNILGIANFACADSPESIIFEDEIEMRFVLSGFNQNSVRAKKALDREIRAVDYLKRAQNLKYEVVYMPSNVFEIDLSRTT